MTSRTATAVGVLLYACLGSGCASSWTPVQVGLTSSVQAFPTEAEVRGLRLAVFDSENGRVVGLDWSVLGIARAENFTGFQSSLLFNQVETRAAGLQLSIVNLRPAELRGAQLAFWNGAESATGVQLGGWGNSADSVTGVQLGVYWNGSEAVTGAQLGGFNRGGNLRGAQLAVAWNGADSVSGVQLGALVNSTQKLKGLQLGLVNICDECTVRILPFVNVDFGD